MNKINKKKFAESRRKKNDGTEIEIKF